MRQYPKYKDSGIQWIGQIPEGWRVKRYKHCFITSTGLNIAKSDLTDAGVAVISYGQIHAKINTRTHLSDDLVRFIPKELVKGKETCKLQRNDFVFADTSEDLKGCGNAAFIDSDREIYAGYHTIIARPVISGEIKYLAYLFTTDVWRKQIREHVAGVKVNSITQKLLNECVLLLPPTTEQQAIVCYLDTKTAMIDQSINLLEQQKTDLQKYRTVLISQTVTRGLIPNAKLKDSGIQWIGHIPEGWEVDKVKNHILSIKSGDSIKYDKQNTDGEYPLYGGGALIGYVDKYNTQVGDILIGRVGANCGCVTEITQPSWATDNALVITPKISTKYLVYILNTANLNKLNTSNAQPLITATKIKDFSIPIAPISEQQAIVDYLDTKTAKIDETIRRIDEQINDLRAYRTAIISEVVTGKIDVRNN